MYLPIPRNNLTVTSQGGWSVLFMAPFTLHHWQLCLVDELFFWLKTWK